MIVFINRLKLILLLKNLKIRIYYIYIFDVNFYRLFFFGLFILTCTGLYILYIYIDTPRDLHLLHVFSWVLNVFGIFFILSGHEHYSIDVFIAFYITSRLFLYYHTLANNQALMQRDSNRTRIWFPLFSFFEASMDGIVPNEYETPAEILDGIRCLLTYCANEMVGFALKSWLMKIRLLFKKTYSSTKSSSSSSSSSRHLFVGSTIGGRRQKLKSH